MLDKGIKVLNKIEDSGYNAYIVGGFPRDYLLGLESNDIDICTNATPKDLVDIFNDVELPREMYGSIRVFCEKMFFDITTFRKEGSYLDNRKPNDVIYIDSLFDDLLRRDFTINTICIDKNGEIIDLLNGRCDLEKKIINTVGVSVVRFTEDALRILRAIRFATILDFELSSEVVDAIRRCKGLLKNISYYSKKRELDKIFASRNMLKGISLLLSLGIDKELELSRLNLIDRKMDLVGIWSVLNVTNIYSFTNNEKDLITKVNEVLSSGRIDNITLYKYGLYVNQIAGDILGIDKKNVTCMFDELPITRKSDLDISYLEVKEVCNGKFFDISCIYNDIIDKVLMGELSNDKDSIKKYIGSL